MFRSVLTSARVSLQKCNASQAMSQVGKVAVRPIPFLSKNTATPLVGLTGMRVFSTFLNEKSTAIPSTAAEKLHLQHLEGRPDLKAAKEEIKGVHGEDWADPDLPSNAKLNIYSKAMIAEHNTIDDCWVVIDGLVFDLTNYIRHHPGGAATLKPFFGGDATEQYVQEKHSGKAYEMRKTWCIGRVAQDGEEPKIVHEIATHDYEIRQAYYDNFQVDGLVKPSSMFCMQCSQTKKGTGCTESGVCGKESDVTALQDMLLWQICGIAQMETALKAKEGAAYRVSDAIINFIPENFFSTLTNVNYDADRFYESLAKCDEIFQISKKRFEAAGLKPEDTAGGVKGPAGPTATWKDDKQHILNDAAKIGVLQRADIFPTSADEFGLREMILYGLKGTFAYFDHAMLVHHNRDAGAEAMISDSEIQTFMSESMRLMTVHSSESKGLNDLIDQNIAGGHLAFESMRLLDKCHSLKFGVPTPTKINTVPVPGKAILISAHDILDTHELLKQCEAERARGGESVGVYTHGELLPAHGYPAISKEPALRGNFGRAWYRQQTDFELFPGPVILTANCLQPPKDSYVDRLYTKNIVGFPGVKHIKSMDFSEVIKQAQSMEGFTQKYIDELPRRITGNDWTTGWGHAAILANAGAVIDAVKGGHLKHIFVVGGCNGWEPERAYYPDLMSKIPKESIVLTLGCKQFKLRNMEWNNLEGTALPRIFQMGQCNDVYSVLMVAKGLSEALGCGVNDLPVHITLGWMEQKAVCIVQTALAMGLRNIRSGPVPPAFLTENVRNALKEKLGWTMIDGKNIDAQLEEMLTEPKK